MRRPITIPGNRPARTAPAGNLLDVRTGSILAGLLVPVAVAVDVGDVLEDVVGAVDVETVFVGAALVDFSITHVFDWHSNPSGQHCVPHNFNDTFGSPICNDEFGYFAAS
jgi:hypothetical protein